MGTYNLSTPARDRISKLIEEGERPIGVFVTLSDPAVTDIMGQLGFHYAIFDCEHTPMGPREVLAHVRSATSLGMMSFVRLPDSSPTTIRQFMDIGVDGLVLPHMETVEEVEAAVRATRFAPEGGRGSGPGTYVAGYAPVGDWAGFQSWANRNTMVIPIIESKAGLENVEKICAIDGVPAVQFGPGDLSQDLGLTLEEMDAPVIYDAWERTKAAAAAHGTWTMAVWVDGSTGGGATPHAGADILYHTYDTYFMRDAAQAALDAARAETH